MNKVLPIVLIFTGLIIFSNSIDKPYTKSDQTPIHKVALAVSSTKDVNEFEMAKFSRADPNVMPPHATADPNKFNLDYVNGVSLYDKAEAVLAKLGQPSSKQKDSYMPELELYAYPGMNISFSNGIVNYVEVLAEAGYVTIDGELIPLNRISLENALGKPDFVAEDGIVFQHNLAVIKIFIDRDSQTIISLHYFHYSQS